MIVTWSASKANAYGPEIPRRRLAGEHHVV